MKELGVVRIEPGNAAGTSIGPKYIQWVQLRDRSIRRSVRRGQPPSAARASRLAGTPIRRPRVALPTPRRQILAAGELADRLSRNGQIPFMIAADWNIDARADAKIRSYRLPVCHAATARSLLKLARPRLPSRRYPRRPPADRRNLLHDPHRRPSLGSRSSAPTAATTKPSSSDTATGRQALRNSADR